MEQFNEQLAVKVDGYIEALLNPPDTALLHNLKDAQSSGLPSINVSPNIDHPADHPHDSGRLVHLDRGVGQP